MKIAFFTEIGFNGKIQRNHRNMRTEFAWMVALDATHHPIAALPQMKEHYDIGVVIIPKTKIEQLSQFPLIEQMKRVCDKIAIMQEGPAQYFQDFPIEQQVWYHNTLTQFDFLLAHNESDARYYVGITGIPTFVNPTLMIADFVKEAEDKFEESVMIGGNFCHWYGGFDSYIVANEFEAPIYAPSMGRKKENEEGLNIVHLPYLEWIDWMTALSKHKYAVHLMSTHAAGTFALNCSYFGIPCIGYKGSDTYEILFPDLVVDERDIETARILAHKLKTDEKFYQECSDKAKQLYEENFTEEKYLEKWEKIKDEIKKL